MAALCCLGVRQTLIYFSGLHNFLASFVKYCKLCFCLQRLNFAVLIPDVILQGNVILFSSFTIVMLMETGKETYIKIFTLLVFSATINIRKVLTSIFP